MSIEMMTLVWHHSRNSGGALLLELAIADHAHDDGRGAYPSIERLAGYARQTKRNVQYSLAILLNSREVSIEYNAGPRGTNLFILNVKLLRKLPDRIGGANISGVKPVSSRKNSRRGMKKMVGGMKNFAGGVKKMVNHRMKPVSSEPNHHKNHHRTVREPSSSPARQDSPEEIRIDRNMQLMMMHFGFEPVIAKRIAEKDFCTDEYVRVWIAHAKRDLDWKTAHDQDDKLLGPGFYYTHMSKGELPLPLLRAEQQKLRDLAHVDDPVYQQQQRERRERRRKGNQDGATQSDYRVL